jgi:hypothetical protein
MDNPRETQVSRIVTIAELCEALESGTLPARVEDGTYIVSNGDLLRFANAKVIAPNFAARALVKRMVRAS